MALPPLRTPKIVVPCQLVGSLIFSPRKPPCKALFAELKPLYGQFMLHLLRRGASQGKNHAQS
jgi:hypothetical protein